MDNGLKFPFYAKASLFILGMYGLISILNITKAIVLPILFSIIIAIVLHPIVNFFVRRKINRVISISITLILVLVLLAAFGAFLYSQISRFSESWPKFVDKFTDLINQTIHWASRYLNISTYKINVWILKMKTEITSVNSIGLEQTLMTIGNGVMLLVLIPVYIFMILFYQPLLLEFFRRLFGADNRTEVSEVITQIKTVIQRYLTGLLIEAVIIAILDAGGLMILGIDYAIILGILGALLNVIPYIGGVVAVAMPMIVAIVEKPSPVYALYVLAIYYVIQLIDNHYIIPIIVASKVKINALISIIVVLAFGALWGIAGMFISIPLTAIIKLIFDHIEPLKPWGFLLGDTMPPFAKLKLPFIKPTFTKLKLPFVKKKPE